jgi:hypothetical protein
MGEITMITAPSVTLTCENTSRSVQVYRLSVISYPRMMDIIKLEALTMPQRCELLTTLPGAPAWAPIATMCQFFDDYKMAPPGSWVSWVNAGVIEHIMLVGLLWDAYLRCQQVGIPCEHIWSDAKHQADQHGLAIAASAGATPTREQRWFLDLVMTYNQMGSPDIHNQVILRQYCEYAYSLAFTDSLSAF